MTTKISTKTSGVGGLEVTGDASGILELASNNGTTAITIDASQNVGIGTASPSAKLEVTGTGVFSNGTDNYVKVLTDNGAMEISRSAGDAYIDLKSSNAEDYDARIQSIGTGGVLELFTSSGSGLQINGTTLKFNSGYGSVATAYGCRAWISFNGSGTIAIRGSGNVSSIVDNGTGQYTINLATAMPDTNFCTVASGGNTPDGSDTIANAVFINSSSIKMRAHNSGAGQVDPSTMSCAVFR